MFVELTVMNRDKELFHTGGLLRICKAGEHARVYLFGVPQPVDIEETYEEVRELVGVVE
jgi:hypothetical protein